MHALYTLPSGVRKISLVFCRLISHKNIEFVYSKEMDFLSNQKAAFLPNLQVAAPRLTEIRAFNPEQ